MTELNQGPIVGIDLGTTNSVVAVVVDGKPQVISGDDQKILPSVVGIDPQGKLITGTVARNQQVVYPDRTITSVKRHMGSMTRLSLGDQTFTPPEISAIILRKLRDRASAALGTEVTRAVITVPAFFDENQRQATREAGELAGLKVERIINEPTAATLVYHAGSDARRHLVVYDFGGGTFDVSIVRMEAGVVEVLSSKGDTKLGGDDLDQLLVKHVADAFQTEHEIDLLGDPASRWRLMQACERAKCDLSSQTSVTISEEFIAEKEGKPLNLNITVTRKEYEELIAPLIDRTIECVDEAFRDSKLQLTQIDELLLVGGSTRTPLVQERLREEFKLEPSRAVDPDLAVALGAAMQAAMIAGQSVGPVLVDVTGHTLGIEVLGDFLFSGSRLAYSRLIHRNTPLPAYFEESYRTVSDEQTEAEIKVYQGEHDRLERNKPIGKFMLDLDSGGGDKSRVVVRFDLTLDGVLKVTATQPATGKKNELRIDNVLTKFREEDRQKAMERIGKMFDDSDESGASQKQWLPVNEEIRLDQPNEEVDKPSYVGDAKTVALLKQAKAMAQQVGGEDGEELRSLAMQLEVAMEKNDQQTIDSLSEEIDDVLFYVQ
ncbi:MAG: Hsp70 family protein [Pirellulaceae bacterium]